MNQNEPNLKQHQTPSTSGKVIETRVVGVTFEGRQAVVALLQFRETVVLKREPDNPYDANAIRVERLDGAQIGYIPKEMAITIAPLMDANGEALQGVVSMLTGSAYNGHSLGVVIRFQLP